MPHSLAVEVHDFGPIGAAKLQLRPLTVLTGPNNAGKSYLSMLIYALSGAFGRAPARYRHPPFVFRRYARQEQEPPLSKEAKKWVVEQRKSKQAHTIEELPGEIRQALSRAVTQAVRGVADGLSEELARSFAAKIPNLARREGPGCFCLRMEQSDPPLVLAFASEDDRLAVKDSKWSLEPLPVRADQLPRTAVEWGWVDFVGSVLVRLFPSLLTTSYYFPAARSGILQGHKALASFILSRAPLAGIQRFEIPTLSGVLADFLANLLNLEPRATRVGVRDVAEFLEERACKGSVDLLLPQSRLEYPEIYYGVGDSMLPLHRTSSMVSEMAPIILFLKYLVQRGDLLIIEEPEAHLHPDNQRILAQAMVRLVRRGVGLLVTTHSDYLLHQLSNFILLATNEEQRKKLGYAQDEYIRAREVGAYLVSFGTNGHGSGVTELHVTEEDGIPEEEFVKIQEALYNETTSIEYASRD